MKNFIWSQLFGSFVFWALMLFFFIIITLQSLEEVKVVSRSPAPKGGRLSNVQRSRQVKKGRARFGYSWKKWTTLICIVMRQRWTVKIFTIGVSPLNRTLSLIYRSSLMLAHRQRQPVVLDWIGGRKIPMFIHNILES